MTSSTVLTGQRRCLSGRVNLSVSTVACCRVGKADGYPAGNARSYPIHICGKSVVLFSEYRIARVFVR